MTSWKSITTGKIATDLVKTKNTATERLLCFAPYRQSFLGDEGKILNSLVPA